MPTNPSTPNRVGALPRRRRQPRRGSILVLALVVIVVSLVAASFCIDVAYMQLVQSQLRGATDAATRAGATALAEGQSLADVRQRTKDIAQANTVAGAPLLLDDSDIVFGLATPNPSDPNGRYLFTPGQATVNSVRVTGRRTDGSPSGGVTLFLGNRMFGTGAFQAAKSATAAIADRDIVVVVDRSSSMNGQDSGTLPSALEPEYGNDPVYDDNGNGVLRRIEALKVSVKEFRKVIDSMPAAEQLGLVAYDRSSRVDATLDTTYTLFDSKMYNMTLGSGTNIGAGIDEALAMLQDTSQTRPNAVPVMIVMTDGQHNGNRDPEDAANDAMASLPRLTIHTMTFSDSADQSRMQSVANIGQGNHVHAADVSQLINDFEQMARTAGAILIE